MGRKRQKRVTFETQHFKSRACPAPRNLNGTLAGRVLLARDDSRTAIDIAGSPGFVCGLCLA
ncbi:MAG: hypothetical protein WCX75_00485 [Fibrobacteraceae bacterium]